MLGFLFNLFFNIWIYLSIGFWIAYHYAKKHYAKKGTKKWWVRLSLSLAILFSLITIIAVTGFYFM